MFTKSPRQIICGSNFYESDVTMVLRSDNRLETKSQERLYRPFTERRDLMNYWTCPIFKNKTRKDLFVRNAE